MGYQGPNYDPFYPWTRQDDRCLWQDESDTVNDLPTFSCFGARLIYIQNIPDDIELRAELEQSGGWGHVVGFGNIDFSQRFTFDEPQELPMQYDWLAWFVPDNEHKLEFQSQTHWWTEENYPEQFCGGIVLTEPEFKDMLGERGFQEGEGFWAVYDDGTLDRQPQTLNALDLRFAIFFPIEK